MRTGTCCVRFLALRYTTRSIYFSVYTLIEERALEAKIFKSGNSQAVRIPKELRLDATEVEIFRRGDELILKPKPKNLAVAFKLLGTMPSDFMEDGRENDLPQERELL